jgi:hypothetical protein
MIGLKGAKKIIVIIIFIILAGSTVLLSLPVNVLVIKNYHDNQVLFQKRVDAGFTFTTLIQHSVHKTPVYEHYRINSKGEIIIQSTSFQDLGWGVPSTFDFDFKFQNNMMVIENINIPIDFLPFRVSYIAEPYLILDDGRKIDLAKIVDNYERIDIYVERISHIAYWIRGEVDAFPKESQKR